MTTKYGKKVIASYEKYLDDEHFIVIILDGDTYYNIHLISEKYAQDELNTLQLQEPHSKISNPEEYFDKKYMIAVLMQFFIWDRFYDEGVISSSVNIHEIEEH